MTDLTHIDADGNAVMVDVGDKSSTDRVATAACSVLMQSNTITAISSKEVKKGDVLSIAQLAGIMGSKKTAELIPLCHPIALTSSKVELKIDPTRNAINITANCKTNGQTGVEMEALTAVAVAALTIYDMCKAIDRGIQITDIRLTFKSGGKSGTFDAI
ncbi:MAG: cyclic pyranopterin monophosphate synthase MoaC [Rickettsiales bacterium]|jgi:cyclic pyranopterin phosphate synthase|nr:cyclic pyranopterin monophosphate synthase MoaC [Rickettsiales bacterium]|tara:strand:- start:405 stop:881 length:477 start_codon:yes stop_codon:yes gene_type:complete